MHLHAFNLLELWRRIYDKYFVVLLFFFLDLFERTTPRFDRFKLRLFLSYLVGLDICQPAGQ